MRLKHHVQCTLIRETRVLDFLLLSRLLDSKRNWLPSLAKISFVERFLPSFSARFCWRAADAAAVCGMKEDLIWNQFGLLTTDWIPSRFFFLFPSPRSSYYLPSSSKGKNHWEWRMIFHLLPFVWQSHLYFSCNTDSPTSIFVLEKRGKKICFRAGSNRGPCACEAHVITTTLRKLSC